MFKKDEIDHCKFDINNAIKSFEENKVKINISNDQKSTTINEIFDNLHRIIEEYRAKYVSIYND